MKVVALLFCLMAVAFTTQAQTADQIIGKYFENTGGKANWAKVKGVKMHAKVNQGGFEMPLEIVQLQNGNQYVKVNFQGKEIMQNVFNGETLWSTNFQTMKPEKADAELTKLQKQQSTDFPDALFNYKEKGYKAEFIGKETLDGTETFKVKVTKKPMTIEGKEVENVTYYYFDVENYVLIGQETEVPIGPGKGMISQVLYSDYQEVDGLYFPFSLTQGVKGQAGQPLTVTKIELNPEVSAAAFAFPAQ